jgi:hypothetical protein
VSTTVTNSVFLEAMFADALPGTYTILCSFPGDPYNVDRRAWAGRPWAPGQKLPARFGEGNTYLTVSTFEPDPQTGETRRRKANFIAMHAVMIDDVGTKVLRDKLLLKASAAIETSPGNYQIYLFLHQDSSARDRALCERLVARMIAAGLTSDGKDPGMRGVTRFGRLPVGINGKAKYVQQLGHAFATRCVVFRPQLRYTIPEVAAAWQLDLTAPQLVAHNVVSITPALVRRAAEQFTALIDTFKLMSMYIGQRGAWHDVICPWLDQHTDRCTSGTAIAEPSPENGYMGGFVCHHGHCQDPKRTMRDVHAFLRELVRLIDDREVQ